MTNSVQPKNKISYSPTDKPDIVARYFIANSKPIQGKNPEIGALLLVLLLTAS
jgi:hypothetical protein